MADEKYRLTLEGSDIDEALLRLANYEDEGLVLGSRKGVMLGPGSEYYHKNARYYAELAQSAVPGDTTSAVRWDIDQSALTDADRELARKNIRAGGSNRNLLDNPFFQVNQRGWTSGTANAAFTVDRWKMSSAYGTKQVTVNADGTITFNGLFFQKFEPHFIAGQVVTISYMAADGNVVSTTGTIGTTEAYAVGNASFGLYYRPSTGVCDFQIQADNLTLRACKVELGSVSTLANDAPPDYYDELDNCKWYFERIKAGNTYAGFGIGVAFSTTNAAFLVNMHPKRNNQYTVVTSGVFGATPGGTITSLVVDRAASNGVLNLYATGTFVANSPYVLRSATDANVYIDINNDL